MADLLPVDDVIKALLAQAVVVGDIESVGLSDACGRVLALDLIAEINVPPAANSAMDGYALLSTNPAYEVGGALVVSDRIAAGYTGQALQPGTLARIFTGAPLPDNSDAVVMQENTEVVGDKVKILQMVNAGENVRAAGQDISKGATILTRGRLIRPQDVGLIASVGINRVPVYRKLNIAIMSTGDELVEPSAPLQPGQIYNSNHYTLSALVRKLGMNVIDLGLVADTPEATEAALLKGAEQADCIISSGGVSVGEEDHVKGVVEKLGSLAMWRLAIKPGKPLAFGQVCGTPFFGLPGNPVSTFVTFLMIARPWLLKTQGGTESNCPYIYAETDFAISAGGRREYLRVLLEADEDGTNRISLFKNQGSGVMSSVSWANGLAELEIGQQVSVGDRMKVFLL